jgi:hypothetical protein
MARESGIETLNCTNRPRVVPHHFGGVVRVLSLLSLMPLLFTLVTRAWHHVIPYGLTTTALILTGGLLKCLPGTGNIQHNEALND